MTTAVSQDAILPMEIEGYVEALKVSSFQELGTLRWLENHGRVEKLTVQAVIEAMSENREEVVKEMLISHEKLPVLVHDVILIELWREEIFPKLMKLEPKCTFTLYTVLYHEATCVNLIETILYHSEAAESLGDSALDLTDYCFRSLNLLMSNHIDRKDVTDENSEQDLKKLSASILFRIAFKCLTCIRYLIENLDRVSAGVLPRLMVTADTPMLLTQLLIQKPWRGLNKHGDEMEYNCESQSWVELDGSQRLIIGKLEAQAWLAIYQLFMNSRVISTYEIHEYRRSQLLNLRSMLNEVSLDQIPILVEFQRWLNQLAVGSYPMGATKCPFLIEMLPPIRTSLDEEMKKHGKEILKLHRKELVENSQDKMTQKANMLASTYDFEAFESVLPPAKCAGCGAPAVKKCSRCRSTWYCKRECQVANWAKHKELCDMVVPK